jgi:Methylase involved in ubiquinone/menaquinone biosynthesis
MVVASHPDLWKVGRVQLVQKPATCTLTCGGGSVRPNLPRGAYVGIVESLAPAGSRRRAVVGRRARRLIRYVRKLGPGAHPPQDEESRLKQSWATFSPETLEAYLVSGYQNPRINAQSIIARHFFVRQLFGSEFDELMQEELKFCVETNEAIRQRAAEMGVTMGAFTNPDKRADVERVCAVIADREQVFEGRWRDALAAKSAEPISVLELACGSANDYRSLASYGIARFLDYSGVDLNDKNIANAKARFDGVNFEVGSILDLPYEDGRFDYVLAFDIFEHLSLSAMEQAMSEAMRLARKGLVFAFFIMTDAPEHNQRPKRNYHWNELSVSKIEEMLRETFPDIQAWHIPTFLKQNFEYGHYYNKKAYTIIAQRRLGSAVE